MPKANRLRLSRETLTELTPSELARIDGGNPIPPMTPVILTIPLDGCVYTVKNCWQSEGCSLRCTPA